MKARLCQCLGRFPQALPRLHPNPHRRSLAMPVPLATGRFQRFHREAARPHAAHLVRRRCCRHQEAQGAADDSLVPTARAAPPGDDDGTEQAVRLYFEGDRELFQDYRAACLVQFPGDIQGGDTASAAADLQTLLRVAHSLKSVLLTLGHPQYGALARTLEEACHAGVLAPAQMHWAALRAQLVRLAGGG